MCGRTACTLNPDTVSKSCRYEWKVARCRHNNEPSLMRAFCTCSEMLVCFTKLYRTTRNNAERVALFRRYRTKDGSEANPSWVKNKDKYIPSHNKAPQSYCPVLLGGNHFQREDEKLDWRPAADERVLAGMRWGLIPNWFKGMSKCASIVFCRPAES